MNSLLSHSLVEPYISERELKRLSWSKDFEVLLFVANNARTPKRTLARLSHYHGPEIDAALAANPSCSQATFQRLAGKRNPTVLMNLLHNRACPTGVFEWVVDDFRTPKFGDVLFEMIRTGRVHSSKYRVIALEGNERLREAVLLRADCPQDVLLSASIVETNRRCLEAIMSNEVSPVEAAVAAALKLAS